MNNIAFRTEFQFWHPNPLQYTFSRFVRDRNLALQDKLKVYFRVIIEEKPGNAEKWVTPQYRELVAQQSGPWLDNLPLLKNGKLDMKRPRWTLGPSD